MKKFFAFLVLAGMLCVAVSAEAAAKQQVNIAGSSTGGTWYMLAGAMSNVLNKYQDLMEATPIPSAGSFENIRNMRDKRVDFGIVLPNVAAGAYKGVSPWQENRYEGLSGLFNIYSFPYMVIVKADSPIQSLADLKGKTIGGGPAGGTENVILMEAILPYYGLGLSDVKLVPLTDGERASALTDGHIDVGVWLLGVTSPTLTELTTVNDVRFIPLEKELLEKANAAYPFYTIGEIAPGTFKGQAESVSSIVMWGMMNCGDYMDEELVYQFTKTIFDHKAEVEDVVRLFKDVNFENAILGIDIPIHPGARRYFEEKGVKFD